MIASFFFTTPKGLEDILIDEIKEKFRISAYRLDEGIISCEANIDNTFQFNFLLRGCYKVFILLKDEKFSCLEDLYEILKDLPFEYFIGSGQSFAIECQREGGHNFYSLDVERISGQALIDRLKRKGRRTPKANLEDPDVTIFMKIKEQRVIIGIDTTGRSLQYRGYRQYLHPAGLNPVIAYGLVRISGWEEEYSLYDPFCGGGTILIEALRYALRIPHIERERIFNLWRFKFLNCREFRRQASLIKKRILDRELKIFGSDISPKHIEGARLQLSGAPCRLFLADACKVDYNYDFIVTNPPYGMRGAKKSKTREVLSDFNKQLLKFERVFKNAVILSYYDDIFKDFRLKRKILYGALPVFILRYRL